MKSNKSKSSRLWAFGLIILIIVNISALVTIAANTRFFKKGEISHFDGPDFRGSGARGDFKKRFVELFNLTPEQSMHFTSIRVEKRTRMMKLYRQMLESRDKLYNALTERQLDMEIIDGINGEIIRTDAKIRQQIVNLNQEIRKILDKDQLEIYFEMIKSHKHKEKGFGRRSGSTLNMIEPTFIHK